MDFKETIEYLYNQLPFFQNSGSKALNLKLDKTLKLCAHLNHPEQSFKSIHIAGTNGKGSTSHMIASVLAESGFKTGLYTSPHLKSFTERIKINGIEIPESYVVDFVSNNKKVIETWGLSFFELTVGMCFSYFADSSIDFGVIETGMGGRLDSTNVIAPELTIITNVSLDHQQYLGDTIRQIANEKAGIIKNNTPLILGELNHEIDDIFTDRCKEVSSDFIEAKPTSLPIGNAFKGYQFKNVKTAITALEHLSAKYHKITSDSISAGLTDFDIKTGLKGRWQKIGNNPLMICDTGHNEAGIRMVLENMNQIAYKTLHIVFGTVNDKDHSSILKLLPIDAKYYFCTPKINRALSADDLCKKASQFGLKGLVISDVNNAINQAKKNAQKEDLIFIGGSTFVVAEIDNL